MVAFRQGLHSMVHQTEWLTGQQMVKEFFLLPEEKVVASASINSLLFHLKEDRQKNCLWHMQSSDLIHLMENKWHLPFARRCSVTGNVIAEDGTQISIFSILQHRLLKIFRAHLMLQTNYRCGMVIIFIFSPIAVRNS